MNTNKTVTKVEAARHWINGEWVGSATIEKSMNPSTGEMLGQYAAGGRVEAAAAIAAARKAFDTGVWPHHPQLRCRGNFSTQALHCTMLTIGADRVLFAADYPYE
jgi:hypothetical protein